MGFDNFILGPLSTDCPLTDTHRDGQTERQIDNKSETEHWDEVTDRSLWNDSSLYQGQLKCDGTRAEARFRLSAKRMSPFKLAGASFQSTTGSRRVRISGSNARYTMFRGSVRGTDYPLHSLVSPSLPLPCVNVCHHISTGVYPSHDIAPPSLSAYESELQPSRHLWTAFFRLRCSHARPSGVLFVWLKLVKAHFITQ